MSGNCIKIKGFTFDLFFLYLANNSSLFLIASSIINLSDPSDKEEVILFLDNKLSNFSFKITVFFISPSNFTSSNLTLIIASGLETTGVAETSIAILGDISSISFLEISLVA